MVEVIGRVLTKSFVSVQNRKENTISKIEQQSVIDEHSNKMKITQPNSTL